MQTKGHLIANDYYKIQKQIPDNIWLKHKLEEVLLKYLLQANPRSPLNTVTVEIQEIYNSGGEPNDAYRINGHPKDAY